MSSTNKVRLAILDDYQQIALTYGDWDRLNDRVQVDVYTENIAGEDELAKALQPYEIICCMRERTKFPASLIDRLPNLRLLSSTGVRNLGIATDHAKSKGIIVSHTGHGAGGFSTLEHIWALILATVRHLVVEDSNIKSGNPQWQTAVPGSLAGKTLGLIGVGKLGQQTAQVAKAFNLRVLAWSPSFTPERANETGVEYAESKRSLLEQSDIVSLHLVLSDSTRHILKGDDLACLKPNAYLINSSRGPLIEESALVEALTDGRIRGAGLDVYDIEPLPLDHPLRSLKNVTLTPHNGYVSEDSYQSFWVATVENVEAYLAGSPIRILDT